MSAEKKFDRRLADLRRKAEARLADSHLDAEPAAGGQIKRLLHDLHVHQIELELQNEELRKAQRELERSRDGYLELYHNAPVGYVVTDSAGMILQANKTFGHMLDRDLANILHKPLAHMIHGDDQAVFLSRFRSFYNNPLNKRLEVRMTPTDRRVIHTQLAGRRIDPPGASSAAPDTPDRLLITISDITQRRLAELAIIRAKTQWEQTFDAVPDLIAIINEKSEIVRVNQALARRLGVPPQACEGKKCYHVLHERRDRPAGCPHQRLLTSGRPSQTEAFNRKLGGHFITTVAPFKTDEQGARWCIHISHDITDRKRVESELLKSRSLESIGTLAGGMAHDFNNILTALLGNIEMLKLHLADNQKARPFLDGAPGSYVRIDICDQGGGIRAEVLEKIFDPYFSTKEMGPQKGMGLGLAISHSIIRKHRGHIAVYSSEGQGTTVTIHLPVTAPHAERSFRPDAAFTGPGATRQPAVSDRME
ncbi:MAG: PAS domain-containing protein [Desulfobacterales bacterium]